MTWVELAKDEAKKLGVFISDEIADYLLWECTAFPATTDQEFIRGQIQEELNQGLYRWRAAYPPPDPTGPSRFERLEDEAGTDDD